MTAPGPIALRALADAVANLGVTEEGGENRGKAVETYLRSVNLAPGNPWCAAFVSYRLQAAAKELGQKLPANFMRSGYCPDYELWAKTRGLWIPRANAPGNVLPGDLCLFWFEAKNRVAHIGIVERLIPAGVQTIEGNTSDSSGVDRDGDGVFRKARKWGAFGVGGGFVRLPF